MQAMPRASRAADTRARMSGDAASPDAARRSSRSFSRQATARPIRTRRGQKPGPSWPRGTMASSVQVDAKSRPAPTTVASRAVTRAREAMLLAEAELPDEPLQRGDLPAHPLREVRGALVGVGAEVPLLREFLPLGALHRLVEGVPQDLDPVGRGAFLRHHAAELGQRDVEPQLLVRGHVREGGMPPLRGDDQLPERAGLEILQDGTRLLVEHLGG